MVSHISIGDFIIQKGTTPIFDVRTPSEFEHAHIPNAINLPIFSDEERAHVGTTYKQKGRGEAIKLGFDYTGTKWRGFIEKALEFAPDKKVFVHCWRGGMRSGAMAWALGFYGFDVTVIEGGYKSYRNWVLKQFEKEYPFIVLGGKTGSHKTDILLSMQNLGAQVIDLEGLANHLGSAYGTLNEKIQPSQEMFENMLAEKLNELSPERKIWLENESSLIGKRNIPPNIFRQKLEAELVGIVIDEEKRVKFLTEEYGTLDKDFLTNSTLKIRKRLGPEQTQNAVLAIEENRMEDFIRIVLEYYDKAYVKGVADRDKSNTFSIEVDYKNDANAAKKVLEFAEKIKIDKVKND